MKNVFKIVFPFLELQYFICYIVITFSLTLHKIQTLNYAMYNSSLKSRVASEARELKERNGMKTVSILPQN